MSGPNPIPSPHPAMSRRVAWGSLSALLLLGATTAVPNAGAEAPCALPSGCPVVPRCCCASHAPHPACGCAVLSLERLAEMSWPELEQLYRHAPPGAICEGYARGKAIYCPDEKLAGVRSKTTGMLWHGKVFRACDCRIVNQWCGVKAIEARVYYGPSWLDGKPSIIMDYCGTSKVWADVRDEVREVAPGLFVGLMYRRRCPCPEMKMFFALETCPAGCR